MFVGYTRLFMGLKKYLVHGFSSSEIFFLQNGVRSSVSDNSMFMYGSLSLHDTSCLC